MADRDAAPGRDQLGQRIGSRIDDRAGRQHRAGVAQFVARGENGNARPAADLERAPVGGRGEAEAGGRQPCAGGNQQLPGREVAAGGADIAGRAGRGDDSDPVAVALDDLLDDDSAGALRNDAAGRDPHRRTRSDAAAERSAGGGLADHAEARACHCLRFAHGIAVHGRHRVRRLIPRGDDIGCQRRPPAVGDRQRFSLDRSHVREQQRTRLVQGEQGHSRRQSPDLPPLFATSSIRSIVIPRALDFSMS